jgi:hypothetical protein
MSHCTSTIARYFVLAVLSVAFLMCGSAFTQDKADSGDNKIKELKKQRLALLVKIQKGTAEAHKQVPDEIPFSQVRQTTVDVFAAQLDLAETKDDRIRICEEMVQDAVDWEKGVEEQFKQRQASGLDAAKAQADVLAARIALEKTKASK